MPLVGTAKIKSLEVTKSRHTSKLKWTTSRMEVLEEESLDQSSITYQINEIFLVVHQIELASPLKTSSLFTYAVSPFLFSYPNGLVTKGVRIYCTPALARALYTFFYLVHWLGLNKQN